MTDSTSTTSHDDFVEAIIADRDAFDAEQKRIAAEAEARKSIARGALTQSLFSANLDIDDLHKVAKFIEDGCEFEQVIIVDNDDDSTELEELKAKLAKLERERDELKADIEDAEKGCEFHMDLKTKKNLSDSIGIFSKLSNGNGGFVSNWAQVIDAGFEKIREDAQKNKPKPRPMPKSPPVATDTSDKDKDEKKSVKDRILGK